MTDAMHWVPAARASTLPALFAGRVALTPNETAYRYFDPPARRWRSLTWAQAENLAGRWRAGLAASDLSAGARVAILVRNSPSWVAVDQAALDQGLVSVGLFCGDTPASSGDILRDSGAALVVVAKGRWWRSILEEGDCPAVRTVVALDGDAEGDARLVASESWLPDKPQRASLTPAPEELASLVYTSGTSGRARGVMLSHASLVWNAYACARAVDTPVDEHLVSFVPLAHAYERTVDYHRALITGATLSFCRHPRFLSLTLANARPTALVGVPRIYEHYYMELQRSLTRRPRWVRRLVRLTTELGWSVFQRQQGRGPRRLRHLAWPLLRQLVARPCLRPFGGRLEVAISGAAALPRPVARTLIGLGLPLLQGYGLTEAGPVVSVNRTDDNDPASVGRVLDDVQTRLGPDNELWVRTPGVMEGYWGDAEATAAVIEAGGNWLRTGDKVSRLDQSRLFLTGRLKEIIVMATGDKASPEPLERTIGLDPLFTRAAVVGEARPYLAALVTCDGEALGALMGTLGLDSESPSDRCDPRLERAMLKRIGQRLRHFPVHAQVRRVAVIDEVWSVENGLLTVTEKLRRRAVARRYAGEIERLYGRRAAAAQKTDFSYNVNVG